MYQHSIRKQVAGVLVLDVRWGIHLVGLCPGIENLNYYQMITLNYVPSTLRRASSSKKFSTKIEVISGWKNNTFWSIHLMWASKDCGRDSGSRPDLGTKYCLSALCTVLLTFPIRSDPRPVRAKFSVAQYATDFQIIPNSQHHFERYKMSLCRKKTGKPKEMNFKVSTRGCKTSLVNESYLDLYTPYPHPRLFEIINNNYELWVKR